jgi:glycosyltransferase involved in cell wall biosynthesis
LNLTQELGKKERYAKVSQYYMHKIVHIITRLDMGGSAQNTILSCIGLAEKYDIILVHGLSLESKMTDREVESINSHIENAKDRGVKFVSIFSLIRKIHPFNDFLSFISLLKLIKIEKPVIVHTHSSKAGLLGRIAAWISRVPMIIHTPHGHVFYGHFGKAVSRLFLLIERLLDNITDHTIALTEQEGMDYIKLSVSSPNKITTIHSGVELEPFIENKLDVAGKKIHLDSILKGKLSELLDGFFRLRGRVTFSKLWGLYGNDILMPSLFTLVKVTLKMT